MTDSVYFLRISPIINSALFVLTSSKLRSSSSVVSSKVSILVKIRTRRSLALSHGSIQLRQLSRRRLISSRWIRGNWPTKSLLTASSTSSSPLKPLHRLLHLHDLNFRPSLLSPKLSNSTPTDSLISTVMLPISLSFTCSLSSTSNSLSLLVLLLKISTFSDTNSGVSFRPAPVLTVRSLDLRLRMSESLKVLLVKVTPSWRAKYGDKGCKTRFCRSPLEHKRQNSATRPLHLRSKAPNSRLQIRSYCPSSMGTSTSMLEPIQKSFNSSHNVFVKRSKLSSTRNCRRRKLVATSNSSNGGLLHLLRLRCEPVVVELQMELELELLESIPSLRRQVSWLRLLLRSSLEERNDLTRRRRKRRPTMTAPQFHPTTKARNVKELVAPHQFRFAKPSLTPLTSSRLSTSHPPVTASHLSSRKYACSENALPKSPLSTFQSIDLSTKLSSPLVAPSSTQLATHGLCLTFSLSDTKTALHPRSFSLSFLYHLYIQFPSFAYSAHIPSVTRKLRTVYSHTSFAKSLPTQFRIFIFCTTFLLHFSPHIWHRHLTSLLSCYRSGKREQSERAT